MKYVVYESFDGFAMTNLQNYKSYVQDCNKITRFKNDHSSPDGIWTYQGVIDYCCKYFHMKPEDFVPAPY